MSELKETLGSVGSSEFLASLGDDDRNNLGIVMGAVERQAQAGGLNLHLIAVGGMVDRKKRGQPHKDIDLVLVSPDLAIDNSPSNGARNFDKFESFLKDALRSTGWESRTIQPFWDDYARSSNGTVTFLPPFGKPIELLPISSHEAEQTIEEYTANQTRPYSVLF